MTKNRLVRCCALLLVVAFMLGGCTAPARQVEHPSQSAAGGKVILIDPAPAEISSPYQPEAPAADDASALIRHTDDPASAPEQEASVPAEAPVSQAEEESSAPEVAVQEPAPVSTAPAAGLPLLEKSTIRSETADGEVRSVWISYLELQGMLMNKTKEQFTKSVQTVFDNCVAYGLNTVIVHVRPFADALYQSKYYPWSYLCTGTEGVDPGYDPLAIMVEEAHARKLEIEAWLNPYRIRAAGSKYAISQNNQAVKWLTAGDDAVIAHNGATSYNPASQKAQNLIVDGVREIIQNYAVDGIHIDDYFYPASATGGVDMAFDAASYKAYKNAGGKLSQADWRRQNVEVLLKAMYAAIKEENPKVRFGISPQSSVYNNYNAMFLDVAKIVSTPGYCDYVCPQIYFGYQNDAQPYQATLESWEKMITTDGVDLYVGLAAYKLGASDKWAGAGQNEWLQNTDLLARMVKTARNQSSYKGFVLYRYDSIFAPDQTVSSHVAKESGNLKTILG